MLIRIIGGHGGIAPGYRATSYLIDGKLLLDAGSVASGIMIKEQLLVENILISHTHLDHISDLAFISDNCFGTREVPFEVYCHRPVRQAIQEHLMNDIIWPDFSKIPNKKNPTIRFHNITPEKVVNLKGYKVLPAKVNHPGEAMGFIIQSKKDSNSVVFTQDTGPTERIWQLAKKYKKIKAIFTEVSFPNKLQELATNSQHHTPQSIYQEIAKMPKDVPVFLGHIKPMYQSLIIQEIEELACDRISLITSDDTSYIF